MRLLEGEIRGNRFPACSSFSFAAYFLRASESAQNEQGFHTRLHDRLPSGPVCDSAEKVIRSPICATLSAS